MDRFTIRLYDGMSHYDFPCYMADSGVYHSLLDSYPIKAVYTGGDGCEILRKISDKKMKGHILEKMCWSKRWRMQLYYYESDGETVLCCTGSSVETLKKSDSHDRLIIGDEIEIGLDFKNMSFTGVENASHTIHEKDSRISNLYNEESELLFIDLEERRRINLETD